MKQAYQLLEKLNKLLLGMGFREIYFERNWLDKPELSFVMGRLYCRPAYIGKSCIIMEYAFSYEDAKKNLYDDGDQFSIKEGEVEILEGIRNELQKAISDMDNSQVLILPDLQVSV